MANGGPKKWFMLQLWRLQQVAQILTIVLLAFQVSLTLWGYVKWRNEWLANPISGVLTLMIVIFIAVWSFAIAWDLRFKMWREQMTVLTERNPYAREKMNAKEVALYRYYWLPLLETMSKQDPKLKENADFLRTWLDQAVKNDPILKADVEEIKRDFGMK